MKRVLVLALLLAACGGKEEDGEQTDGAAIVAEEDGSAPPTAPDAGPRTEPKIEPDTMRDPGLRLEQWGQAIAAGDTAGVVDLWTGDKVAEAQTFAARIADWSDIAVNIGSGRAEGAAGSIYYRAPIELSGTDTHGERVTLNGMILIRRVNDIDGATSALLQWHVEKLDIDKR